MTDQTQAPALPAGVDFTMQEAMTAEQLQHLLRQDWCGEILRGDPKDPGRGANVVVSRPLRPWMVTISGAFMVYGQIQYYETEIDIRLIEKADDFLLLVAQLNKSFDKAAETLARG